MHGLFCLEPCLQHKVARWAPLNDIKAMHPNGLMPTVEPCSKLLPMPC